MYPAPPPYFRWATTLPNDPATIEEAFTEHLADRGLTERDVIWLPVYSFEHSGLAFGCTPFSDRWDSGQVGYIYMSRADIRREYGVKRITRPTKVAVYHRLEAEIATQSDWLNGETYYFAIPALDDLSIGGFYGSDHEASGCSPPPEPKSAMPSSKNAGRITRASNG